MSRTSLGARCSAHHAIRAAAGFRLAAPLAIALLVVGCGGGTTAPADMAMQPADLTVGPDLAQPALSFADFKSKMSSSVCKFIYNCCKPAERMQLGMAVGMSEMECELGFFDSIFQGCSADVAASRASFDPAAGQACLDLLDKAACGGGITQFDGSPCDNNSMKNPIFRSNQGTGMPCSCESSASYGCKTGYCDNMNCVAFLTKGADCSKGGVCDPAARLYCDGAKCADIIAEGGDCTNAPQGCEQGKDYCDATNKCKALLADGGDCSSGGAMACKSGYCDMNNKCAQFPIMNVCTGM
jgi:hypothetical protein